MENKLGQEEAFACASSGGHQPGISKRFYAACAAMQGLLSANKSGIVFLEPEEAIRFAYFYADELLKQEN